MLFDLIENELKDWVKVEDIQQLLKEKFNIGVSRRTLRAERENVNEKFYNHEIDYCIARSSKGYKRTKSEEDIIESEQADFRQAIDMLQKYYKSKRARGENLNMKLKIDSDGFLIMEE